MKTFEFGIFGNLRVWGPEGRGGPPGPLRILGREKMINRDYDDDDDDDDDNDDDGDDNDDDDDDDGSFCFSMFFCFCNW